MPRLLLHVLLLGLAIRVPAAFDPFAVVPEDFNTPAFRDKAIHKGADGNEYRIRNHNYEQSVEKSINGEWLRHGPTFRLQGGNVSETITYRDGKRDGPYLRHIVVNGESALQTEGAYADGKKTGRWKVYDTGTLQESISYRDGKRHGLYVEYRLSGKFAGQPAVEKTYRNGRLHGVSKHYHSGTGNVVQVVLFEDNLVREKIFYDPYTGKEKQRVSTP